MSDQETITSQLETLADIVEQGMCIGCGLCQGVAGEATIRMERSPTGYLHPQVVATPSAMDMEVLLDACPSRRLDALPAKAGNTDEQVDPIWGRYQRLVHGWARDPEQRFEGSTGGVLTALGAYLVESGKVTFILHARPATQEPTFGECHLSFSQVDVLEGVGSRYGPTAVLLDIEEVLAREQPFAVIAKPCDISALRNYARHDPRVGKLVKYWLSLVCGGFMPTLGTEDFVRQHDIDPQDLTAFRYRGRGFPGPTRGETADGRVMEVTYHEFWGENYDRWTLPHRCKVCPDSLGEAADIVAADPWPGGGPDPNDDSDPGTNVMIARTDAGDALLREAERDGALVLSSEATIEQMNDYQPHQVARKYTSWPRLQGLKAEGRQIPQMTGLRVEELAQTMSDTFNADQREGTRRRVRDGKASEPRPVYRTD